MGRQAGQGGELRVRTGAIVYLEDVSVGLRATARSGIALLPPWRRVGLALCGVSAPPTQLICYGEVAFCEVRRRLTFGSQEV